MTRSFARTHTSRLTRATVAAFALLIPLSLGLAVPANAAGGKTGDVVIITGITSAESSTDRLLTRKVNEYEGQHRLVAGDGPVANGKGPEVPVSPN